MNVQNTVKKDPNTPAAVSDEDLSKVNGGLVTWHDAATDKYYKWVGGSYSSKYLCPNCGRPLSSFWGINYSCSSCDASWFYEDRLVPNYASGTWNEITKEQYDQENGKKTHSR